MFLLALIYLIILVVAALGFIWNDPRVVRLSGAAQWALFAIIGIVLFWNILNK
jgi:hypothetical protein